VNIAKVKITGSEKLGSGGMVVNVAVRVGVSEGTIVSVCVAVCVTVAVSMGVSGSSVSPEGSVAVSTDGGVLGFHGG